MARRVHVLSAFPTEPDQRGKGFESEYQHLDPKGGDLCAVTAKLRESVVEAGQRVDVQIIVPESRKGAKDSSNYLVAGSCRSFPQDRGHSVSRSHILSSE